MYENKSMSELRKMRAHYELMQINIPVHIKEVEEQLQEEKLRTGHLEQKYIAQMQEVLGKIDIRTRVKVTDELVTELKKPSAECSLSKKERCLAQYSIRMNNHIERPRNVFISELKQLRDQLKDIPHQLAQIDEAMAAKRQSNSLSTRLSSPFLQLKTAFQSLQKDKKAPSPSSPEKDLGNSSSASASSDDSPKNKNQ